MLNVFWETGKGTPASLATADPNAAPTRCQKLSCENRNLLWLFPRQNARFFLNITTPAQSV